jgi:hypothetical protein
LRRSSRLIVDGDRFRRPAMHRTLSLRARPSAISSRSSSDKYRPDGSVNDTGDIPPLW